MERLAKNAFFLLFALFIGNFSNKHHYNLSKIPRIFSFWYFCPKWLFLKLFVLKVDLCVKVVALIKITTVYYLDILDKLLQLQKKHSKYMFAKCPNFPCFMKIGYMHACILHVLSARPTRAGTRRWELSTAYKSVSELFSDALYSFEIRKISCN